MLIAILAAVCFVLSARTVSAESLITATNTDQLLEIAKGFGSADLSTDSSGDPVIRGRIDGSKYSILFYGCKDGNNCKNIQFVASWTDTNVSLEDVNEWNKKRVFGRAYIDKDSDPVLDLSVNINYGVSRKNMDDTFDWWARMMKKFHAEVIK